MFRDSQVIILVKVVEYTVGIIKGSHKMSTSFHRIRCYQRKGDGRYKISLVHKEKGKIKCYRSRLVALAWVCNTNPEEYTEVCHIDNNPLNDYYKNL